MTAEPFTPPAGDLVENLYNVTVLPSGGSKPRSFLGELYPRTWVSTEQECLYVGNGQGGPSGEYNHLPDSVIEGRYSEYITKSLFDTDFKYTKIQGACAV